MKICTVPAFIGLICLQCLCGWPSAEAAVSAKNLVKVIRITSGKGNDTEAAWSPDGQRIAFQSDRDGRSGIYILDLKSEKVKRLETGPGYSQYPAWSPDGKYIAYSYAAPITKTVFEGQVTAFNMFIVPADGGAPRQLTSGNHIDYCPTFSPAGDYIYFTSTRDVDSGKEAMYLHKVPVSTGNVDLVSKVHSTVQVSFSPDGDSYTYGSIADYKSCAGVFLSKLSSNSPRRITPAEGFYYSPRWSPKQDVVACTGYRVGQKGWGIWLLDLADDGRQISVTGGSGNNRSPAWSPDGQSLVYECNATGQYKLYREKISHLLPKPASNPAGRVKVILSVSASTNANLAPFITDNDFSDGSGWYCEGVNQWVEITLTSPQVIKQVNVHSGYLGDYQNPSGEGSVKGCQVRFWDGAAWKTLAETNSAERYKGGPRKDYFIPMAFAPVKCEKLRIVVTESNDTRRRISAPDQITVPPDKVWTCIREVEVIGQNGKSLL
ncbi:MAG: hypothetical protein NT011_13850 [Kiritimatiellaeota bacterium]|nr:hypothetical protein [Kiritimatiellota bacterium]